MGPWKCNRPGCNVSFASHAEWVASVKNLQNMKNVKSTDEGKKALAARSAAFAKLHPTGQNEHEPPILEMNMDKVILDPLHDLLLNLPKTLWKYCFGDRMTNSQREVVAEYLSEIGCPLDIRAKSDGRDAARKWFTGGVFQHFVEGGKDATKGGLKRNIEAIVDIIFNKYVASTDTPTAADATTTPTDPTTTDTTPATAPPTAAAAAAAAAAPAHVAGKRKAASAAPRARSRIRVEGFSAVEDAEPCAESVEPRADSAEPCAHPGKPSSAGTPAPPAAEPEDAETASHCVNVTDRTWI